MSKRQPKKMDEQSIEYSKSSRKNQASTRLSIRQPTKISRLRRSIRIPVKTVPKLTNTLFPVLAERPIDEKLPHYEYLEEKDGGFYTRGKLGQKIMRLPSVKYSVEDEWNHRKVAQVQYEPLHDPFLFKYLNRPVIKENLIRQGLLRDDEVVCNLKKFNGFRKYAGVLQRERLAEILRRKDTRELERDREITELKVFAGHKKEAIDLACKNAIAKRDENLKLKRFRMLDLFKRNEIRRKQAELVKKEVAEEMSNEGICRELYRRQAYLRAKKPGEIKRKDLLLSILAKEDDAEIRIASTKVLWKKYNQINKLCHVQTKINREKYITQGKLAKIQNTFKMELQKNSEKYYEKMEKRWERLPKLIAQRRSHKNRIMYLVRKCFFKWLAVTRKAREHRKLENEDHHSHWNVTSTLDAMNCKLCGDGRVKIENMSTAVNVITQKIRYMKEGIAAELQAEEDAEAQQAGRASRGSHVSASTKSHTATSSTGRSGYEADREIGSD